MIPYYKIHVITKYECFLSNGIRVIAFTKCYLSKNLTVSPETDYTGSYAG